MLQSVRRGAEELHVCMYTWQVQSSSYIAGKFNAVVRIAGGVVAYVWYQNGSVCGPPAAPAEG